MNDSHRTRTISAFACAVLFTLTFSISAFASNGDETGAPAGAVSGQPPAPASEAPSGGAPASTPVPLEEQLQRQSAMLEQMQQLMLKQQAVLDRMRSELDELHKTSSTSTATPAAGLGAVPATATATAATTSTATGSAGAAAPADDELSKKVEGLEKLLANIKFSGDVRFRYEGFYNQGFDGPLDVNSRNRFRIRARLALTSKIDNHFDWGLRLASGSFDDPISVNQTLGDFYDRKVFAIDRAFLHYTADAKPVNLEVWAGKFDFTWKRQALTYDSDLQPEGLSEKVKWTLPDDSKLKSVSFIAWQLPFKERALGADAYIYGGQILTDWKWNDNWSSQLAGTFQDFEQANVIPPATLVSPTLVNAGIEFATTNTLVLNPYTNLLEYRSKFRPIDVIADVTYRGLAPRFPVHVLGEWLHNTSAFNNQKDGGLATIEVGQRKEQGDLYFDYAFFKAEKEVFPSVFMESDVLTTNGVNHWVTAAYMVRKNIEFSGRLFFERRLQTNAVDNRWLRRFQLDMVYYF